MIETDIAVLRFGDRRLPRALASLRSVDFFGPDAVDAAVAAARRVVVLGSDADLAAVLSRLMRTERLDIEVAHLRGRWGARRALTGTAARVPLIRDDTGTALVGSAQWLPPAGSARLGGEAVVDDTVLFDGEVAGVEIEPTGAMPGLRAAILGAGPRRWVSGRAAQLGTTGVAVVRDGVAGPRELKRSTFYRHTTGWLRVH
ncbi:MAG: peptidase M50 [Mycobacterium sp.]